MSENNLNVLPIGMNNVVKIEPANRDSGNNRKQDKENKDTENKTPTKNVADAQKQAGIVNDNSGIDILA